MLQHKSSPWSSINHSEHRIPPAAHGQPACQKYIRALRPGWERRGPAIPNAAFAGSQHESQINQLLREPPTHHQPTYTEFKGRIDRVV